MRRSDYWSVITQEGEFLVGALNSGTDPLAQSTMIKLAGMVLLQALSFLSPWVLVKEV